MAAKHGAWKAQISDNVELCNNVWTARPPKHVNTCCQNKGLEDKKHL